jgi:hypothetical protein
MTDPATTRGISQQAALLLKAVESGADWQIKGSSDWDTTLGKLTVSVDLPSAEWDVVYDLLANDADISLPEEIIEEPPDVR